MKAVGIILLVAAVTFLIASVAAPSVACLICGCGEFALGIAALVKCKN